MGFYSMNFVAGISSMPLVMVAFVAMMYFMTIRPQQQRIKKQKALLDALKVGDKIITNGGIIGTISKIREQVLFITVAEKVVIEITRNSVGAVVNEDDLKKAESERQANTCEKK